MGSLRAGRRQDLAPKFCILYTMQRRFVNDHVG